MEGQFKGGHRHGYVRVIMKTGGYAEGYFKDGKMSGYARLVANDGTVMEGTW